MLHDGEKESAAKWISVLHRQFQMYLNRELKAYGIHASEYIYLVNLYERDGVSQETLSRNLYINKAATARAIGRLEKLGYVRRTRDAADARAYAVTLTPEGLKLRGIIRDKLRQWTRTLASGLSEEEYDGMLRIIKRMSANALALVEAGRDADCSPPDGSDLERSVGMMTKEDMPPAWYTEVCAWPGVKTGPHRFGGTEFLVGGKEIGHTHGFALVDIPLPKAVRDDAVARGKASPHHIFPASNWVSVHVVDDAAAANAVELLRFNYERLTSAGGKQE